MAVNDKQGGDTAIQSLVQIANQSFDQIFQVSVSELLGFDGKSLQRINADNLSIQIEYDGSSNPIYVGLAAPGSATDSPSWQIRNLTFDGSNDVTSIRYADGDSSFNKVWDNRNNGTYVYS